VHDKTVRRRRLVLALLVVLSLFLVTAYFGEPNGGPLHTIQRGFFTVISPIQDGANKALKPVRDLFSSVHDAFDDEGKNKTLTAENQRLTKELIDEQADAAQGEQLQKLYNLDVDAALDIGQYGPVNAEVDGVSPTLWYSTVNINVGTSGGVQVGDPVINGDGVVGKVTLAESDASQVQLITDETAGVAAQINGTTDQGIIAPKQGDPNNLVLSFLPSGANPQPGGYVVTAGTVSQQDPSLFPPGLEIGVISSVNVEAVPETVNVRPSADVRALDVVQVLTRGTKGVPTTTAIAAGEELPPVGSQPSSGLPSTNESASTGSTGAAAGTDGGGSGG